MFEFKQDLMFTFIFNTLNAELGVRMEKLRNEHIKEIMGVKEKPDIIDIIKAPVVWPC